MALIVSGDITEELPSKVQEYLNTLPSEAQELHVKISSFGGDLESSIAACNLLLSTGLNVNTYCLSSAYSAALLLFSIGRNRIMYPSSSLMLHNISIGYRQVSVADLKVEIAQLNVDSTRMLDIISKHTKISRQTLNSLLDLNKDIYITPKKALEMGFATDIVSL